MTRESLTALLMVLFAGTASGQASRQKSLDCLQVSVLPQAGNIHAGTVSPPPRIHHMRLLLKNVCAVDVTAYLLEAHLTSPVSRVVPQGWDVVDLLDPTSSNYGNIPLAGRIMASDIAVVLEPAERTGPLEATAQVNGLVFRDRSVVGQASWIGSVAKQRKLRLENCVAELVRLRRESNRDSDSALLQDERHLQSLAEVLKAHVDLELGQ